MTSETIKLPDEFNVLQDVARHYSYDPVGNVTRIVDRNDRVRDFEYNAVNQPISERWYDNVTDRPVQKIDRRFLAGADARKMCDRSATERKK